MSLSILGILVGTYLIYESIAQAAAMNKGDKLCRVAKYLCTASSGFWMIWLCGRVLLPHLITVPPQYIIPRELEWRDVLPIIALALFLWPRTYGRIRATMFDRRHRPVHES